jgi:hypothetical protein
MLNEYTEIFPGGKRPEREAGHFTPSIVKLKIK